MAGTTSLEEIDYLFNLGSKHSDCLPRAEDYNHIPHNLLVVKRGIGGAERIKPLSKRQI